MLPRMVTPKYDMIVPSSGEAITYRPYVVKEEKLLLIALESEDDKQIEQAVSSIITACLDESVDINALTGFDIEFIFLTLRELINLYLSSISLTTHFKAKTALLGLVTTGVKRWGMSS